MELNKTRPSATAAQADRAACKIGQRHPTNRTYPGIFRKIYLFSLRQ